VCIRAQEVIEEVEEERVDAGGVPVAANAAVAAPEATGE